MTNMYNLDEKLQAEYDAMIEEELRKAAIEKAEGCRELPGEGSAYWDPEPDTV